MTTTNTKITDEVFQLTDSETDVTATDISTGQTSLWLQGWRFQVPVDQEYVFTPEDTFSIYAKDLATAELTVADILRIRVEDPSHTDSKLIIGPLRYTQLDDFTDADLIAHLDLSRPLIVKAGHWIIIEVYCAVSLDESACYWALTCRRIRTTMF